MSPRQVQQVTVLVISAAICLWALVTGRGVVVPVVGLVACVFAALWTLRYYRRGGLPLDRGGKLFWRR